MQPLFSGSKPLLQFPAYTTTPRSGGCEPPFVAHQSHVVAVCNRRSATVYTPTPRSGGLQPPCAPPTRRPAAPSRGYNSPSAPPSLVAAGYNRRSAAPSRGYHSLCTQQPHVAAGCNRPSNYPTTGHVAVSRSGSTTPDGPRNE
ncbi:MAG: hypothetical protein AAGF95_16115 [Chloroflexota bacterium]